MDNPNEQEGFSAEDRDLENASEESIESAIPDRESDLIDLQTEMLKEKSYEQIF